MSPAEAKVPAVKLGRNDPCACGSGRKFKKCCSLRVLDPGPEQGSAPRVAPGDVSRLFDLMNAGRYPELEIESRALSDGHPHSGLIWKMLGLALWMQGKESLPALQRAAQLLPEDAEAHCNLGNVLRAAGRGEDAVSCHRRALEINSNYAEAHNNLGSALRDLGQLEEALASYRRAIRGKPDFAMAHANLGSALQSAGHLEESVASYRRAVEIEPGFAVAHGQLGQLLRTLGRFSESERSLRRAVALRPQDAELHTALGTVLMDLGRIEDAVASYRRALEIEPELAKGHSNLGSALYRLGDPMAAEASFRRALDLNPDLAEAHNNLANILLENGDLTGAVAGYRRALAVMPDFPKAHSNLGSALFDLGHFDEAEASLRRALVLEPEFAEVHTNLGMLLRQQGRPAEAEDSCRRALAIKPRSAAALAFLGDLNADKGQFVEAEALFRSAISIEPGLTSAWAGISGLRTMGAGDAAWFADAQRIAGRRLRPKQEAYLRYALGKYFDDLRDFEQAFSNYRRANELMKLSGPRHDRQLLTRAVDAIMQFYDEDWAREHRSLGAESSRPVFIVGMPRSGTSLAEQILASHPAVFGAGELPYWSAAARECAAAATRGALSESFISGLTADYLRLLQGLSPDALRVVDKMPGNFLHIGLIHSTLPNARIIHLQRHPIDTCLSIYFQHFSLVHSYANDLDDLAQYYADYLRAMKHWRRVLPRQSLLEVPYEGLVDSQEQWSRRMIEFIGLDWDPVCMDFHRTSRHVSTFSKWQVRQKINRSSIARWRNYEKFVGPLLGLDESLLV